MSEKFDPLVAEWISFVKNPNFNLIEKCLKFSQLIEYPELQVDDYIKKIHRMGMSLKESISGCVKLLEAARKNEYPIAFTRYIYKEDYSDGGVLVDDLMPGLAEVESLKAGTWDIEILDELTPNEGETVVDKNRPSAYYNTNLNEWLEGNNLSQIILCGVTTSICVETTTRDLSQEDYRVVIASDAVNELEPDRHEVALKTLAFGFAWVNSVDEIISRMN